MIKFFRIHTDIGNQYKSLNKVKRVFLRKLLLRFSNTILRVFGCDLEFTMNWSKASRNLARIRNRRFFWKLRKLRLQKVRFCLNKELSLNFSKSYSEKDTTSSTIMVIIFWDFLMFGQIFLLPQVTRNLDISNKHSTYELSQELLNDLRA